MVIFLVKIIIGNFFLVLINIILVWCFFLNIFIFNNFSIGVYENFIFVELLIFMEIIWFIYVIVIFDVFNIKIKDNYIINIFYLKFFRKRNFCYWF